MTEPYEHNIDDFEGGDKDGCVVCGRFENTWELGTCDGCGSAVCRECEADDDFGNTRCAPECGV